MTRLKCYVNYCTEQFLISERIASLRQVHGEFSAFLEEIESQKNAAAKNMDGHMKLPKKRLYMYRELLSNYIDVLSDDSDEKEDINTAIDTLDDTIEVIENHIIEKQFVEATQQIYRSLEKNNQYSILDTINNEPRYLECSAKVTILATGGNVIAQALLFEDSILFTVTTKKEVVNVLYQLSLLSTSVKSLQDCIDFQYAIELKTAEVEVRVEMPDEDTKILWLKYIDELQKAILFQQMMTHIDVIDEESNSYIQQAQELLEEFSSELPIEYVNALEEILGSIGESREARKGFIETIDKEEAEITELIARSHQLNKNMAHASAVNGNSGPIFAYAVPSYTHSSTQSIAESVSTGVSFFMKRPVSILSNHL